MKVWVVGGGGREHALAWKSAQSPMVDKVFVAPGNAGTCGIDRVENVDIDAEDVQSLVMFASDQQVDLTIVGPEAPLVAGIADAFHAKGLACFGPVAAAARLEESKEFAKEFLRRHDIPTAAYQAFSAVQPAIDYAATLGLPVVIKADGLAAGKGVVIAQSLEEAKEAISDMLEGGSFGRAGSRVVVEEFLHGEEASFICVVGGGEYLAMASSQDHKAAYNGDKGPNTGGMGAYSPAPVVDSRMHDRILKSVIEPTVQGLLKDGIPYTGFLYAGLMIGDDGIPRVLEYNCRFGDPETQPIMMRMDSDLVAHCLAAVHERLGAEQAKWSEKSALGIVLAAAGYPGGYEKGHEITGIAEAESDSATVFHAGTTMEDGRLVTSGGRVLCVTALGESVKVAQEIAYRAAGRIHWKGCWKRDDIGHRAVKRG